MLEVEQALFTSARTAQRRGYQLVARSAGVREDEARELCRWGPTHGSLLSNDAAYESLNCFPVGRERLAVTRTVSGGPEYSGRGDLQTVTMMLVLRRDQLRGYNSNPIDLARTALTLGFLRLRIDVASVLPKLLLPPVMPAAIRRTSSNSADQAELARAVQLVRQRQRIAIVGTADRQVCLWRLLDQVAPHERASLSFATGLVPSASRPFQVHHLDMLDRAMENRLAAQGITPIGEPVRT